MRAHWLVVGVVLASVASLPAAVRAAPERKPVVASSVESPASNKLANLSERRRQKKEAEQKRADLQAQLSRLKQEIDHTEAAKDSAADTLAAAEDAVSTANASLRELQDEQKETEQKLKSLAQAQKKLAATVAAQQRRLANWLRAQYVAGNEDRIKLLLSGDNPNRINRDLQYMSYLSQAQAKLLDELRANLAQVEQTRLQVEEARSSLLEIAEEEQAQTKLLEQEKQRRAGLLTQLSKRLASQRKEAGNLARDEQRLSGLVDKLAKMVEEQRKAEAAAAAAAEKRRLARQAEIAEQQRKLALAKAKEREGKTKPITSASSASSGASSSASNVRNNTVVASASNQVAIRNELVPIEGVQATSFASLRGQLRLPLRGSVAAKFGSKRGEGPSSKGVFIRAGEGEPVKAIAQGRVVFAEWLRGFGNLLIVDHGGQYMSIYGNNQTLLKRAGDVVKSGDTIANAGNSGGNEESGLYFELRHQGRAFDPLAWVNIR